MDRDKAYALLCEYTKSPNLIKHMLAVESAMRFYARKLGQDEDRWGIVGLLHDLDYEQWPSKEDHPLRGAAILEEKGYPEDVIYAIKSHAEYLGLPRKSPMDKALFAADELTGFIVAVALVRPSKSIMDVKLKSIKKKLKEPGFARAVNREEMREAAEDFGVDYDEHIQNVLAAMQEIADDLGLN